MHAYCEAGTVNSRIAKDAIYNNLLDQIRSLELRIKNMESRSAMISGLGPFNVSVPISRFIGKLIVGDLAVDPPVNTQFVVYDSNGDAVATIQSESGGSGRLVIRGVAGNQAAYITLIDDNTDISWYIENRSVNGNEFRLESYDGVTFRTPITIDPSAPSLSMSIISTGGLRIGGSALPNPIAGQVIAKAFGYDSIALNDDQATFFTPAQDSGIIMIGFAAGNTDVWGIATFRASGSPVCIEMVGGSNFAVTTGALTGTTGTDTFLTVSTHTDGRIYIENRRGAVQTIHIAVFSGA